MNDSMKHHITPEDYTYERNMRYEEKTEVRKKDGALAWVARKNLAWRQIGSEIGLLDGR